MLKGRNSRFEKEQNLLACMKQRIGYPALAGDFSWRLAVLNCFPPAVDKKASVS
jgi:hypothetical protein